MLLDMATADTTETITLTAVITITAMTVANLMLSQVTTAAPVIALSVTSPTIRLRAHISGMTVRDILANKDRENSGSFRPLFFV